jgi:Xaa-Pro aminopeptidase
MNSRIKKVKDVIKKKGLDAILITDMSNIRYISNFTGSNAYVFLTAKDNYFFTDGRYTTQSKNEVKDFKISICKDVFKEMPNYLPKKGIKKIGFEDESLTCSQLRLLRKYFKKKKFYPVSEDLKLLRAIKDEGELNIIKKAVKISEEALLEIKKKIKPGITESYLANEFERLAKEKGAEGLSFDTILVSGKNSALVHGKPSDKKIRGGELVLIDFGCVYKGYRSDQTVTYGVGKLSDKAINIYKTVRDAQIQALGIIKPGVEISKPVKIVDEYIKSKGYEFVHGLGHGVGLQIHEQPNVSLSAKGIFQEGMVVTVEPGVYVENVGGVRIEDLIVVTKNGYKKLTTLPKDLEIL